MLHQGVREALFEQLARIGKAVSSPKRIELLDVLIQGERSVESLAQATGMTIGNTSSHLQALSRARMVQTRREGTKVLYSLPDQRVEGFVRELWSLAEARLAEVEQLVREYLRGGETLVKVSREELVSRSLQGDVYIVDVRPAEEFKAGHIPGAVSIPLEEITDHLSRLPSDMDVVAYCRGPFCLLAPKAAQILRQNGYQALVFEEGMPGWRQAGLPVSAGNEAVSG